MEKDARNQRNEGQPIALLSLRKSEIWSMKLLPDRGGGNGGGTMRNAHESQKTKIILIVN